MLARRPGLSFGFAPPPRPAACSPSTGDGDRLQAIDNTDYEHGLRRTNRSSLRSPRLGVPGPPRQRPSRLAGDRPASPGVTRVRPPPEPTGRQRGGRRAGLAPCGARTVDNAGTSPARHGRAPHGTRPARLGPRRGSDLVCRAALCRVRPSACWAVAPCWACRAGLVCAGLLC